MGHFSASNPEKAGYAGVSIAGSKFGMLLSGSYSHSDDMKMGSRYPSKKLFCFTTLQQPFT